MTVSLTIEIDSPPGTPATLVQVSDYQPVYSADLGASPLEVSGFGISGTLPFGYPYYDPQGAAGGEQAVFGLDAFLNPVIAQLAE